jgi:hypothetical protein
MPSHRPADHPNNLTHAPHRTNSRAARLVRSLARRHPVSAFFQNLDDPVAYPEDSLMYARALLLAGAAPGAVHMYPKGGHGFGVCAQLDPVGGFEMVRVVRKTARDSRAASAR